MPLLSQAVTLGYTGLAMQEMYERLTEALETLEPGEAGLQGSCHMLLSMNEN